MSTLLALGMVAALLSIFAGSAGAQTDGPMGQITVVNGLDVAVDVVTTVDGSEVVLETGLAAGAIGDPTNLAPGTYTITFADTGDDSLVASYELTLGAVDAWNVVSGYGDPNDAKANNAAAYRIDLATATPIATVANSSAVAVTVTALDADLPQGGFVAQPDMLPITITTPGASTVTVDVSGAPTTSYNFVVAIGTDDAIASATVTIANLAELKTALEGTTPPTTLPPATEVQVPDVTDRTEADAVAAIEGVNLVVAKTEAASDTVDAGVVISQDPAPDTIVGEGSTVNIVVSTGPDAPAVVPVPDVAGQDAADARTTLEAAGFTVEISETESETVEAGTVIESNPSAGTEVAEGTTVVLTVSSGMGDVVVPDFSGMTIAEATDAAQATGLTITFVEDPNKPDPEGIVVSQDPEEGTNVEAGSEVVAQLSPAFDDAWAILVVDANRELTVTGINFQPNTTTESSVLESTVFQTAAVGDSGSWTTKIDISSLDSGEHFLNVTGTSADGSAYDETFKIPEAGQSTDEATTDEAGGFPWWGWLIIGLLVIAVVAIGIKVFGGSDDGEEQPTADSHQPTASN